MKSPFVKNQTAYVIDRTRHGNYKIIECMVITVAKYITVSFPDGNKKKFQPYKNDTYCEVDSEKFWLVNDYERAKNFADTHNLRIAILNRFRDPFDPISLQQFQKIAEILDIEVKTTDEKYNTEIIKDISHGKKVEL